MFVSFYRNPTVTLEEQEPLTLMLYRVNLAWAKFELTTLVVIVIDWQYMYNDQSGQKDKEWTIKHYTKN
jgi:hypothetical protein